MKLPLAIVIAILLTGCASYRESVAERERRDTLKLFTDYRFVWDPETKVCTAVRVTTVTVIEIPCYLRR